MNNKFKVFVKECEKWIKIMELSQWGVDFKMDAEDSNNAYASVRTNLEDRVVTIDFFSAKNKDRTVSEIKNTAKHEVIHILLADISDIGTSRFVRSGEFYSAEEALVQKLTRLIK